MKNRATRLLKEVRKINYNQPTAAAAILLAIRARMEFKAGVKDRIGKTFPNGNRGVLFVGKGGVGKSKTLIKIFDGLGLNQINEEGEQIGKWLPSTGGSTGVGIYEVLETYNNSIIFADELSLDTDKHVHVIKQIASGMLCRPKHGSIETTPFEGLLIGATNAIKLPRSTKDLEHLLATLDRFMVVKIHTPSFSNEETMDMILNGFKEEEPDWNFIEKSLTNENVEGLTKKEKELLRVVWADKSREILDPTRAQWRNAHAAEDIFLFAKRFFDLHSLSDNKEVLKFAIKMVDDCIIFNPVHILWMTPLEQVIFDKISSKDEISTQEILREVENAGLDISRQYINRVMNKMVSNYVICKVAKGKYSTMKPEVSKKKNKRKDVSLASRL